MERTVIVGIIGVVAGVMIQVVTSILQTDPSMNMSFWTVLSYPFLFSGLVLAVAGYAKTKEQMNSQIGRILLVVSIVALVTLVLSYSVLTTAFFPRFSIYLALVMDSTAVFFIGLLYPRLTRQKST